MHVTEVKMVFFECLFFFDENGYVALIGTLASRNQKVTNLKKVGDL
jgi:hypothetical protein